jgi:CBS domain-containing protein
MSERKITTLADVMTHGVVTIEPTATVREAVRLLREHDTSSLIVERRDEHDEFGVVVVTDIARDVLGTGASPDRVNVYEIMSKPVLTLPVEMNVVYAVRVLVRFKINRVMVVDHDRTPVGIVTLRDMVLRGFDEEA